MNLSDLFPPPAFTPPTAKDYGTALRALAHPLDTLGGALDWVGQDIAATGQQVLGIPGVRPAWEDFLSGLKGPQFNVTAGASTSIPEALGPKAGREMPAALQGKGPLVPGGAQDAGGPRTIPYKVPKMEVPQPELAQQPDFSEVSRILAEAKPDEIPPMSKAEVVLSILGGIAQGFATPGGFGKAALAAGAGAAQGLLGTKAENLRRQQQSEEEKSRYAQVMAQQKAREVLARAGVDAENVAQMNQYKMQLANAQYEQQKAGLTQVHISPYAVTTVTPDPATGRASVQQLPGPAVELEKMKIQQRTVEATLKALGVGGGKAGIAKFNLAGTSMPIQAFNPAVGQLMLGAQARAETAGRAELLRFKQDIIDGKYPEYADVPGQAALNPKLGDEAYVPAYITERLKLYQQEKATTGQSPSADADRALINPMLFASPLDAIQGMAQEDQGFDLNALGGM